MIKNKESGNAEQLRNYEEEVHDDTAKNKQKNRD